MDIFLAETQVDDKAQVRPLICYAKEAILSFVEAEKIYGKSSS